MLCAQDFMNNVCTNVLRLHQKKLIPYGGELIHASCVPKEAKRGSQDPQAALHAQECHTLHLRPYSIHCEAVDCFLHKSQDLDFSVPEKHHTVPCACRKLVLQT